jgi:predicted house-cleaning noncanonical NTP pyrophosphatase (MazG superfamily)
MKTSKVKPNTLIRDNVPAIMAQQGKTCRTVHLDDDKYLELLNGLFLEEVKRYVENDEPGAKDLGNFADIGEIMHAILAFKGIPVEEFQKARMQRMEELGGYYDRLYLKEVID